MTPETFASLVSSVGFPIAAFVLIFRFARDTVSDMNETIQENTRVIQSLESEIKQYHQWQMYYDDTPEIYNRNDEKTEEQND